VVAGGDSDADAREDRNALRHSSTLHRGGAPVQLPNLTEGVSRSTLEGAPRGRGVSSGDRAHRSSPHEKRARRQRRAPKKLAS
jgi:hypothetical protein